MAVSRGVFRVGLGRQPLHRFQRRRHGVRPGPGTPHLRLQLLIKIIDFRIGGQLVGGIGTGCALLVRPKRLGAVVRTGWCWFLILVPVQDLNHPFR